MAKASRKELKVLISTGHLGTAPTNPGSFHRAMEEANPDYVVADAGSSDPGPVYLGEDTTMGRVAQERHSARDRLGRRHRQQPRGRRVRVDDQGACAGARDPEVQGGLLLL